MIIKDKKLKRKLDRVPDKDKNGDPIFKIAGTGGHGQKQKDKGGKGS